MKLTKVERDVLQEGLRDWIGVWGIAGAARGHHPNASTDDVRDITISSIRNLLQAGLIVAGDLNQAGFVPWESTPDESADRVDITWKSLGRVPNPPESAWFQLTDAGRETLQRSDPLN